MSQQAVVQRTINSPMHAHPVHNGVRPDGIWNQTSCWLGLVCMGNGDSEDIIWRLGGFLDLFIVANSL